MKPAQPAPVSPALLRNLQERSKRRENRVTDQITRFAGSMRFGHLHCVLFGAWILLRVEDFPFGLVTMIVSLERFSVDVRDDQLRPHRCSRHRGRSET